MHHKTHKKKLITHHFSDEDSGLRLSRHALYAAIPIVMARKKPNNIATVFIPAFIIGSISVLNVATSFKMPVSKRTDGTKDV